MTDKQLPQAWHDVFDGRYRVTEAGCWEWSGTHHDRRGYASLGRGRFGHRISLELASGAPLGDLWALHHCDNPPCVRPDHLYAGTHADNMADMARRGRSGVKGVSLHPGGDGSANAKLTNAIVAEIRRRDDLNDCEWARRLGVAHSAVWRARTGRTFRNVSEPCRQVGQ